MATSSLPKLDNLVSAIRENINTKLQNTANLIRNDINNLQNDVNTKANDIDVVHKSGDTLTGTLVQKNLTLNDGVHDVTCIVAHDEGTNYGSELVIGASGNVYIGSGESPNNWYNENGTSATEDMYISSDSKINFAVGCQTITDKKVSYIDTDGNYVGNVKGNITGNVTGNASSATKLQTTRTINGTNFDGTANITTAQWGTARNISITDGTNTSSAVSVNGSKAYSLNLPSTIKATFVGNITGNVTGNADTATTLKTTRSLWGNNFDGSQNLSGDIEFTNNDLTGTVVGIRGKVGGNDYWRVGGGATENDSGFMELATADNGGEPIYVRQYTGAYATIVRTATLLDASGNTQFPGTVTATTFTGNVTGNCSGTAGGVAWANVSGKPSSYTPSSHTHDDRYYTESEIDTKLSGKSDTSHNHNSTYLGISAKAESAKSADSVAWANVSGKPSSYTPSGHTHDDRYYTETEVNNLLGGKSDTSHNHNGTYVPVSASCNKNWNWNGQNGQPTWLWGSNDGTNMYVYNPSNFSVSYAASAGGVAWANVSGKPSSYTPSSHTHDDRYYTESEIDTKLSGKSDTSHSHSNYLTGITKAMVTNALGYTPPTQDTNTTYSAGSNLSLNGTQFNVSSTPSFTSITIGGYTITID